VQRLDTARRVVLSSSRISRPSEVLLALQSDGSIDVLEPPSDPAALDEIESWSRQQRRPATGALVPAVVHLRPLPSPSAVPAAPIAPAAAAMPAASGGTAAAPAVAAPAPSPASMAPTPAPPLPGPLAEVPAGASP
ncbi:MAG: hypothetical protein ACKO0M_02470, partial [Cyanobium sp.]